MGASSSNNNGRWKIVTGKDEERNGQILTKEPDRCKNKLLHQSILKTDKQRGL